MAPGCRQTWGETVSRHNLKNGSESDLDPGTGIDVKGPGQDPGKGDVTGQGPGTGVPVGIAGVNGAPGANGVDEENLQCIGTYLHRDLNI